MGGGKGNLRGPKSVAALLASPAPHRILITFTPAPTHGRSVRAAEQPLRTAGRGGKGPQAKPPTLLPALSSSTRTHRARAPSFPSHGGSLPHQGLRQPLPFLRRQAPRACRLSRGPHREACVPLTSLRRAGDIAGRRGVGAAGESMKKRNPSRSAPRHAERPVGGRVWGLCQRPFLLRNAHVRS